MNNVQFATSIHILTLLAITKESLSSAYIAGSINTDPSIVRRALRVLNANGLVTTREGKGGGTVLAKPADKLFLSDIYSAVIDTPLLGRLNNPNPQCNTGRQINDRLRELYSEADEAVLRKFSKISLASFCKRFE